ncbi:MAG TPA: hypothetical protein DCZ80_00560 [Legionellales bacterium]|nr:hypothetical protein [Legionellales bacterium]
MMKTKIIGVMASDPNGLIGSTTAQDLPWSYPEDTAFWQKLVKKQPLITGYDTFIKLPPHIFKENLIIVISKHHQAKDSKHPFFTCVEDFLNSDVYKNHPHFYHLGGAKTMNYFLKNDFIDEFYLTEINKVYAGDIFLNIKAFQNWPKTCIAQNADFKIMHYIKKTPA